MAYLFTFLANWEFWSIKKTEDKNEMPIWKWVSELFATPFFTLVPAWGCFKCFRGFTTAMSRKSGCTRSSTLVTLEGCYIALHLLGRMGRNMNQIRTWCKYVYEQMNLPLCIYACNEVKSQIILAPKAWNPFSKNLSLAHWSLKRRVYSLCSAVLEM